MSVLFEDLSVGQLWKSGSRTLGEAELTLACMTSGDWHPIHADADYAKNSLAGQRLFHGTYGLHLAVAMAAPFPDLGEHVIGALGLDRWNYHAPLVIGDTIHVEVEIASRKISSNPGRGVLGRQIILRKSDGTVAQKGIALTMVRCGQTRP